MSSCHLETNNSKYFCDAIESVSNVLKMGNISVKDDGLYVSGMDVMHVSLIKLEIEKNDFDKFEKIGPVNLGINFEEFVKLLKTSSGRGKLSIIYNESNPKLDIIFENDGLKRKYGLMLMDIDVDDLDVPSIDYHLELELSTKIFSNMINSVITTGAEQITFKIKDKQLSTFSKGDLSETEFLFDRAEGYENEKKLKINIGKSEAKSSTNKKKIYELMSCEGEFNVTLGTSILKNITKANQLTEFVTINMIADNPVRLDYNLNDDGSFIYYYISPKLDD
tara:strand:- start:6227 stop:7063 length:837 start_codon:yes stop_codon:yes gene_type:complete